MLLRIHSDIHSEFFNFKQIDSILEDIIPHDERDMNSILILAGDIGTFSNYSKTLKPVFNHVCKRFIYVIYVYGNHEYYSGVFWDKNKSRIFKNKKLPKNLIILDSENIIIDDVVFIGATLWTNFDKENPVTMYRCERNVSDFECIRKQVEDKSHRIIASDMANKFNYQSKFIFEQIDNYKDKKQVVITHFMPSEICVNKRYKGDLLNPYFYSELGNEMCKYNKPDLWIHGHTHISFVGEICNTKIVCNPYGYKDVNVNFNYNKKMFMEI